MSKVILLLPFFLFFTGQSNGQAITGQWNTVDDQSGKVRSVVEIYEQQGRLFGKVVQIFPAKGENPDPVCDACDEDDPRYKQKIIGMTIIKNMKKAETAYSDGTILDPEEGKEYRCRLWLENGHLMVRGYWGPFYRTQTWQRAQ